MSLPPPPPRQRHRPRWRRVLRAALLGILTGLAVALALSFAMTAFVGPPPSAAEVCHEVPAVLLTQDYHGEACALLGEIWTHPEVVGRTRLNVLVMLTPQFHGVGPHSFSPAYTWPYGGLIVGTDPVAVDATGARIIQAHRNLHFGEERPLEPKPHHIVVADTVYGLGVSDPARIELVRLGWEEGALV